MSSMNTHINIQSTTFCNITIVYFIHSICQYLKISFSFFLIICFLNPPIIVWLCTGFHLLYLIFSTMIVLVIKQKLNQDFLHAWRSEWMKNWWEDWKSGDRISARRLCQPIALRGDKPLRGVQWSLNRLHSIIWFNSKGKGGSDNNLKGNDRIRVDRTSVMERKPLIVYRKIKYFCILNLYHATLLILFF